MTARVEPPSKGAQMVRGVLEGDLVPAFVPGDIGRLGPTLAAHRAAPAFVAELARAYGVTTWTPEELKRVFLASLAEWHGDGKVGSTPSALRIASATCPIAEDVARDPRHCVMCQAFQIAVAREALGDQVTDVGFDATLHEGASHCLTTYALRRDAGER